MKLKYLEWKEFVKSINKLYEGGWEGTPEELLEVEVTEVMKEEEWKEQFKEEE